MMTLLMQGMVFFMPYFAGRSTRLIARLCVAVLLLGLLGAAAGPARANEATIVAVKPVVDEQYLYIDADIDLDLTSELHGVVSRGIPLHFTLDVEIVARRWWWFDKVVVKKRRTWRVIYNALTRQWRVGTGELSLPEGSLEDALARIRHVRGWSVAELADLDTDIEYQGRARLRLDTSRLARPFQIDALNSSAWSLATSWKSFSFTLPAGKQE